MPLQLVVIAFLVVAFGAIVWRFLPRSEDGDIQLPRVLDESIGMWLVRRARGLAPVRRSSVAETVLPEPDVDEIAHRIGVPGAPPPTLPTRLVVSHAPARTSPLPSTASARTPRDGPDLGRSGQTARTRRPSGAVGAQRQTAGAIALAVVAIAVATVALGTRHLGGEVLAATGTPAGSVDDGFVGGPSDGSVGASIGPAEQPAISPSGGPPASQVP